MTPSADALASLTPEQRDALLRRLAGMPPGTLEEPSATAIPRLPRDGGAGTFPLSFAQQRLWFLDQLEPGNPAYNMPWAFEVAGAFDVELFRRGVDEIVRRHEALRTTFAVIDGRPVQRVHPPARIDLRLEDLSALPDPDRADTIRHRVASEAGHRFDLATGPLLRLVVLRAGADRHVVLITVHHIISDAWSQRVITSELQALYDAWTRGRAPQLAELPLQYADYAVWQRGWLTDDRMRRDLTYWRERLAGVPTLGLPTDRPRPRVRTFRGGRVSLEISPETTDALRRLGHADGSTLFMTLLAAFHLMLGRFTGQRQVLIGTSIANRHRRDVEGIVGFFINTLVLRGDLSGNPTVRELLARVRESCLGAYAHQDVPFEQIVDDLQPERDLSRNPLFQVLFLLQNVGSGGGPSSGLAFRTVTSESAAAKFDLILSLIEDAGGLVGEIEYDAELFDRSTIQRWTRHYRTLLDGMTRLPERRALELPLLTEDERHRAEREWNETAQPYERDICIHELFERQVRRQPAATAVVAGGGAWSYDEVNRRANRVARYLQSLGVGPGAWVGVCLDRGVDMVVALLGILKAGAAYVPVEPTFPGPRIAAVMETAKPRSLLTQTRLLTSLSAIEGIAGTVPLLPLDSASPWDACADTNPEPLTRPNNVAYAIFTSGSTGVPKGVMVTHSPVINLIEWVNRTFAVGPADRLLFVTSLCFDLSVYDIFGMLAAGGSIDIATDDELQDAARLAARLCESGITFWDSAPAALQRLMSFIPEADGARASLRLVFASGDWVPLSLPDEVRRRFPRAEFIALGGATEATVWSNFHRVEQVDPSWVSVPYGRPIQNARYYVLDEVMQCCPVGIPGMLYIGDDCLSLGYLNDPRLTAAKYVPDPFGASGGRLYCTGDRVRQEPDGVIEFLGRDDGQVKIRGFRIELGEIETALAQHPAVRHAVVAATGDARQERALVAYVVPRTGESPSLSELRRHLADRQPDYMIPRTFVVIDALPLTANGKVDRKALPAPEPRRLEPQDDFVAPRTQTEALLAGIWAKVLRRPQVGVHNNFFELGGDSILSIQIISLAQQAGVRLTTRDLFLHQTIAELAALERHGDMIAEQGVVTGDVPITPIQRWFLDQRQPEPSHFNQAIFLTVREPIDTASMARAVDLVLHHHDALRLRIRTDADGERQWHASVDEPVPFVVEPLTGADERARQDQIQRATARWQASLNLAAGPMCRVVCFTQGDQQWLLICAHHLVVDGVSWRILLEDLEYAYRQVRTGEPPRLPAKTSAYRDWAHALQRHARTATDLDDEVAYWVTEGTRVAGRIPRRGGAQALDAPALVGDADQVNVCLDAGETSALLRGAQTTLGLRAHEVVLIALAEALAAWTGERTVRLDIERHGREDWLEGVATHRTVGWFTVMHPLTLTLPADGDTDVRTRIARLAAELHAVPRDGARFGLLREFGPRPSRDALRALPASEVIFNYLGSIDHVAAERTLVALSGFDHGSSISPRNHRGHLVEVAARVQDGALMVQWTFDRVTIAREAIAAVTQDFAAALTRLGTWCRTADRTALVEHAAAEFGWNAEEAADVAAALRRLD